MKVWNKIKRSIFPVLIYSLIVVWCLIFILILYWAFMTSLKTPLNFYMDPIGLPKSKYGGFNFENFMIAFNSIEIKSGIRRIGLWEMLINTLVYCGLYGFLQIISPMITSYILAKYSKDVKWTKIIWAIVLINLYVPLSSSLAASLDLALRFKYYDNLYLFAITACGGFGGNFLIFYATWKSVSWTYAEAAFIDGASNFKVFTKIMIPMVINVFFVLLLTSIITHYNNYKTPMVYLPSYPTLAYGVYKFQTSAGTGTTDVTVKLAGLLIVSVPMFILFIIFRKKMMTSLTTGGLKG